MKALLIKEIRSYLSSIIGYAAIIVFLIATGFFVWVFPGNNNIIEMGEASLQPFFSQAPGILIFLLPAFTMRCFAEENKSGTIELLSTKPITLTKIVLSKYLASCIIGIFAILPTLIFYVSIYYMGEVNGNIDHSTTIGGYLALVLLSMTFISIGVLASSIAKNQFVALLIGIFFNFIFYIGFSFLASLAGNPLDYFLLKMSMVDHFVSLQRGVVDSRDLLYFFSIIAFNIFLTKAFFEYKSE